MRMGFDAHVLGLCGEVDLWSGILGNNNKKEWKRKEGLDKEWKLNEWSRKIEIPPGKTWQKAQPESYSEQDCACSTSSWPIWLKIEKVLVITIERFGVVTDRTLITVLWDLGSLFTCLYRQEQGKQCTIYVAGIQIEHETGLFFAIQSSSPLTVLVKWKDDRITERKGK